MYDWLVEEVLDTEAMLEAIQSLATLEQKKLSLHAQLNSYEEVLRDLNSGKTNLKTMFSFKNKDEDKTNYQKKKISVCLFIYN